MVPIAGEPSSLVYRTYLLRASERSERAKSFVEYQTNLSMGGRPVGRGDAFPMCVSSQPLATDSLAVFFIG